MITKNCDTCHHPFTIDDSSCTDELSRRILGIKRTCDACLADQREQETQRAPKLQEARREQRWESFCPPLYRQTDLGHPGLLVTYLEAARDWAAESTQGLGFMGNSGGGKTRLLFVALRRAFDAGRTVEATTHHAFARDVMDAFSSSSDERREKANLTMERLARVEVLLLDDLGKAPSTERCDAELENLIETRRANLRPILWSANGHGKWLTDRFGPDRGGPIVRRLAEFSTVVKG